MPPKLILVAFFVFYFFKNRIFKLIQLKGTYILNSGNE